jgi:parvulin-like peptidyl-prolyl isomerase
LLFALLSLSLTAQARVVDRVAVVVNKDVVTLSEVYELGADFIEERSAGEGPTGPNRRDAEI